MASEEGVHSMLYAGVCAIWCFELVHSNLSSRLKLGVIICGPRIGCSTSKVATIFVGIETLSRLSVFRSMVTTHGMSSVNNL